MKIRIIEWEYHNIRKMGNVTINLRTADGQIYPISLIMMPNGTGKTTTIRLMRGLLSGKATSWDENTVRSFRPADEDCANGIFRLQMLFDDKIYHYVLSLDYEEGAATIQTSCVGSSGGLEDGWTPPYKLKGILDNEEFVNRFIFDGEQAKKTLEAGNEEAEKAIINLYQIQKLSELSREIDELVCAKQEEGVGANTERSVKVLQGKAKDRENKLEELRNQLSQIEANLQSKEKQLHEIEEKYSTLMKQNEELNERAERLDQQVWEADERLSSSIQDTMRSMKRVYNFHPELNQRLKELADNMQELKLPKSAAREFFNELAQNSCCICGRPIGDVERKAILMNADAYLGQEELVAINAIKSSLREYKPSQEIEESIEQLKVSAERVRDLQNERERLELEVADSEGEEAKELQNRRDELKKEIADLSEQRDRIGTNNPSEFTGLTKDCNIHMAELALEEAREKYLKASGTFEFTKKAEVVKKYLKEIGETALARLKQRILEETNQKISNIIKNDSITIDKIDQHLILNGREGASDGQTLAIAYAYIGSLFEHALFEFPFVIDAPAAAMDLEVRREVAKVIPDFFKQLVIFVTSGEVKGFAETFYTREDVQYITVKDNGEEEIECIFGREFFDQYQTLEGGA